MIGECLALIGCGLFCYWTGKNMEQHLKCKYGYK